MKCECTLLCTMYVCKKNHGLWSYSLPITYPIYFCLVRGLEQGIGWYLWIAGIMMTICFSRRYYPFMLIFKNISLMVYEIESNRPTFLIWHYYPQRLYQLSVAMALRVFRNTNWYCVMHVKQIPFTAKRIQIYTCFRPEPSISTFKIRNLEIQQMKDRY